MVITDGDTEIILTIGSQVALVNGQQVLVDCAAELHPPGRTFVPLRFVAEFLGARVHWGGPTQRVIIKR
ncbi:MAG: copper amine oxidase N-terminal domain-containing protein [Candidatus Desulforudis sp.]|nr:copper amine oxidase N-terminal domain-containing protein [Desulforudis sp.]